MHGNIETTKRMHVGISIAREHFMQLYSISRAHFLIFTSLSHVHWYLRHFLRQLNTSPLFRERFGQSFLNYTVRFGRYFDLTFNWNLFFVCVSLGYYTMCTCNFLASLFARTIHIVQSINILGNPGKYTAWVSRMTHNVLLTVQISWSDVVSITRTILRMFSLSLFFRYLDPSLHAGFILLLWISREMQSVKIILKWCTQYSFSKFHWSPTGLKHFRFQQKFGLKLSTSVVSKNDFSQTVKLKCAFYQIHFRLV